MDYGKKSLNKIHSKEWSEPLGVAITKTATHLENLYSWDIGTCFLRGSVAVGSTLLNKSTTKQDLAQQNAAIEENLDQNSSVVKDVLQQKMKEIRNMMKTTQGEVLDDYESISQETHSCVKSLSEDMEYFVDELENYKRLFHMSNTLVVDKNHKMFTNAVERIFKNTIGSSNFETNNKNGNLEKWMTDIAKKFEEDVLEDPGNFILYLKIINQTEEKDICEPLFRYALIIQFQYLLSRSLYGISIKDSERVASSFENFNTIYEGMMNDYEEFFGTPFDPSQPCSVENVMKRLSCSKQKFHEFDEPYSKCKLKKLFKTTHLEDVTMGLILNFTKEDLENDEYYVEGGGNRLKILCKFHERPGNTLIS